MQTAPIDDKKGKRSFIEGHEELLFNLGVILAGGRLLETQHSSAVNHLNKSARNIGHLWNTIEEVALGTPGMESARTLEEQTIALARQYAQTNKEAAKAVEQALKSRYQFARTLSGVYVQNETLSREIERANVQVQGALNNFFELGNDIKPEFMTKIDDAIIRLFGQNPAEARATSKRIDEFYTKVDEFYSAREKNEAAIKDFISYLTKTQDDLKKENKDIATYFEKLLFPAITHKVKEGYKTEDIIFELHSKGADQPLDAPVNKYTASQTREEIRHVVPLPQPDIDWINVATNPYTLAIGMYALARGAAITFVPRIIRNYSWEKTVDAMNGIARIPTYILSTITGGKNNDRQKTP